MRKLSLNTQAILLLTAPLISGRREKSTEPLGPGEYRRLARLIYKLRREPSDLLGPGADELITEVAGAVEPSRLKALLGRGFVLAQALERWEARSIWVVSRADPDYPSRIKVRLKDKAPPILYGAGKASLLDSGGLAVVGSRNVDDDILAFAEEAGRLAARAEKTLISGGARGVDQASMRGAAQEGGTVAGVLADRLERAVVQREHRNLLKEGRLVLISPYDPSAGFNVGHAMQRNKLIYAISDAALVVNADLGKGGTWAGAVEQLEKLRLVPVFVRSNGSPNRALDALRKKGARLWADLSTPAELAGLLNNPPEPSHEQLSLAVHESAEIAYRSESLDEHTSRTSGRQSKSRPAERLFETARDLVLGTEPPITVRSVAEILDVTQTQARAWLERLVQEGLLEKQSRPVRYTPANSNPDLFDDGA